MMNAIRAVLEGVSPTRAPPRTHAWMQRSVALAACEVPTGCGKTVSLLSSVLQFQDALRRRTSTEAERFLARGRFWTPQRRRQRVPSSATRCGPPEPLQMEELALLPPEGLVGSECANGTASTAASSSSASRATRPSSSHQEETALNAADSEWATPPAFLKAFRVITNKRLRAELDPTGSSELRQRFIPPPCTIFYAARTHAQLKQAIQELQKLEGAAESVRMNILGSREHYCVNPTVMRAKHNRTLPVEGNNLGEVCDKLVSLGQCPCVEKYGELACKAISDDPIGGRRGRLWDMEDLVAEGSVQQACPYYAARDLVFFADINFCAYNYLLDPIIRHECKMEACLRNDAIVVLDEAHNVPGMCQDALSLEVPFSTLGQIQQEIAPLAVSSRTTPGSTANMNPPPATGPSNTFGGSQTASMSYPRDFKLTDYTLAELFALLLSMFCGVADVFSGLTSRPGATASHKVDAAVHASGEVLVSTVRQRMRHTAAHCAAVSSSLPESDLDTRTAGRARATHEADPRLSAEQHATAMFRQIYGIVMSLGVTFNPFNFSIFCLSHIKRWLVVLRFLFDRPAAFALSAHSPEPAAHAATRTQPHSVPRNGTAESRADSAAIVHTDANTTPSFICSVRCLDGSLAFQHLLRSTYRVILASGTLSPFDQLAKDLGLTPDMWHVVEGQHVVGADRYQLRALTQLPRSAMDVAATPSPLQCTYTSLSSPRFMAQLASAVTALASTVLTGGVLVFVPNYHVLQVLFTQTQTQLTATHAAQRALQASPPVLFCEPRTAVELVAVLDAFKQATRERAALLFSVYRGKVSEGIDFTDDMARLVLCVGVPLQPLNSWRVAAQRAYSGPEWYVNDAVRAVNQALGRCLRHAHDFGVVVLLECRYAQPDYQRRLSRWCRSALQVDDELLHTCRALTAFYNHWQRAPLSTAAASTVSAHSADKENATGGLPTAHIPTCGEDLLPVLAQLPGSTRPRQHQVAPRDAKQSPAQSQPSQQAPRTGTPLSSLKQHLWSTTAIKMLYEESLDTTHVSGAQFRQQLEMLEEEFSAH